MKQILALILVLLVGLSLVSCNAQVENGGKPTPKKVTSGEYEAEPEEVILYKIDAKLAAPLLRELNPLISQMGDKVVDGDVRYLKRVVAFLSQFNDYDGDLPQYMHSVELLCDAYYDLYVLNCTTEQVKEVIEAYYNGYYALSEEFRSEYTAFETADLYSIMNQIDKLGQAAVAPNEPTSSTQSTTSK